MFTKTNRNDPLVESIKNVMEQNDLLRRVETAVNEHFGVVSKKALPHEYHAEYDALFEETKKCAMAEESDKNKKVATPEHHRAEAIRIHKQIKASGKLPHLVAKKKEHEEAYRKMTGNKVKYPDDLNEAKDEGSTPRNAKEKALAKLHGNPNKITHGDVLKGRGVVEEEKATESQKEKVAKVMHKWKQGKEHIGKSEKTVPVTKKGQKQAVAIALSQAGLSKKQKMDEETSIDSIMEEIRSNLEEKLVAVYESGDETAFADFIGSLTEEQIEILGLNEAEVPSGRGRGLPASAMATYKDRSQSAPASKPVDRVDGTMGRTAKAVSPVMSTTQNTTAQSGKGPRPAAGLSAPITPMSSAPSKVSPTPLDRPTPASTPAVAKPAQRPVAPTTNKPAPTSVNRPAQKLGVARPSVSSAPAKRVPGAAAAAAQKRIGYQTKAANVSPGQMMSMREETEAPKPIKESFESFLRNKFLKG